MRTLIQAVSLFLFSLFFSSLPSTGSRNGFRQTSIFVSTRFWD